MYSCKGKYSAKPGYVHITPTAFSWTSATSKHVECHGCGSGFVVEPGEPRRIKYCKACRERMARPKLCPMCGRKFKRRANEALTEYKNRRFCSRSCASKYSSTKR